jgi:hypothetical protein
MVTTDVAETGVRQLRRRAARPVLDAKREDVKDIASRSRTPAQYLLGEMSNVNGETLKASESGLISKVKQRMRPFGEAPRRPCGSLAARPALSDPTATPAWRRCGGPAVPHRGRAHGRHRQAAAGSRIASLRQAREDYGYPPSCARCAILAGRIYRDLDAFQRHPLCDCVMVPVETWQDAHDNGLISSPQDAFDKGEVRGLSQADAQAVTDGADLIAVVNATRGIASPTVFGRKVKATTAGTTKRAAWRKANPTTLVRLRPESIYDFAKDREDAIRLLKVYGYIH